MHKAELTYLARRSRVKREDRIRRVSRVSATGLHNRLFARPTLYFVQSVCSARSTDTTAVITRAEEVSRLSFAELRQLPRRISQY